jgi:hypothetical protein
MLPAVIRAWRYLAGRPGHEDAPVDTSWGAILIVATLIAGI